MKVRLLLVVVVLALIAQTGCATKQDYSDTNGASKSTPATPVVQGDSTRTPVIEPLKPAPPMPPAGSYPGLSKPGVRH